MDTYGLVRNSPAGFPALAACVGSLARATFSPANALEGVTVGPAPAGATPHFRGTAIQRLFFKKFPAGRIGVAATGCNIENSRLMRRNEADPGIVGITGAATQNA